MKDEIKLTLLNKYQRNELTEPEAALFFAWYHQADAGELHRLLALIDAPPQYEEASPAFLEAVERKLAQNGQVKRLFPRRWVVAAAVAGALVIAGSLYLLLQNNAAKRPVTIAAVKAPDIAPGRNGAMLTLSDGRHILLDSLGNGRVIDEKGARINIENGSLSYDATNASGMVYNTISTPVARQYKLVLPDQSVVWLNAGSSVKYPIAFTGRTRTVEMTGEAYFEVARDAARPFHVQVNKQVAIEVLGTHFNINAYENEPAIRATLLEGSIKTTHDAQAAVLAAGEQANITDRITLTRDVNTGQVVAWKNGTFNFDRLETKEVMRQLARWYDVEVVYEPGAASRTFYGEIGRNLSLAQVLEGLKLSGVNCRIAEGKKLVVLP